MLPLGCDATAADCATPSEKAMEQCTSTTAAMPTALPATKPCDGMELGGARKGGAREGGARSEHHAVTPNHWSRDTSLVTPDCCKEATPRPNDFEALAPPATAPRPTLRVVVPAPLKPPPPAKPAGRFIKVQSTTRLAGINKRWVGPGRCGPGTMRVRLIIAGGMIGTTQDSDHPPAAEPVSWQDDGAGAVNDQSDTYESDADESVQKWIDAIRSAPPKTVRGYAPHMGEKMDGIVEGYDIGSAEAGTMDATMEQVEEWIATTDAVSDLLLRL